MFIRTTSLVPLLLTGGITAVVAIAMAEQGRPPPGVHPSPPSVVKPSKDLKVLPSPEQGTEQGSPITVTDGRLSVQVQNRPLDPILEEISRAGKVAILRPPSMGGQLVSVQFRDLPLDEGLRQLLRDQDAFFFYEAQGKAPASLRAVWVYPKGQGRRLQPVPPEAWASTTELEGDLADPDPRARAQAVGALVERKGDRARDAVLQALQDPDDQVRTRALYEALGADVQLPLDALIDLALRDPSPDVRFLALEALANGPEARTIAEAALSDPSPHLRSKASEILRGLEAATRPQQPGPPAQSPGLKPKKRR